MTKEGKINYILTNKNMTQLYNISIHFGSAMNSNGISEMERINWTQTKDNETVSIEKLD